MMPENTPTLTDTDLDDRSLSMSEQRLRLLSESTPSKIRGDRLLQLPLRLKDGEGSVRVAIICTMLMLAAILSLQILQIVRTSPSAPISASLFNAAPGSAELAITRQPSEELAEGTPVTATTSTTTSIAATSKLEPRSPRVLVVWQGFGGKDANQTSFKEKWMAENHRRLESTKEKFQVDYLVYCFLDYNITVPEGVELVYERGIVWQYTWRHLQPEKLSEKYDYILYVMDDVVLADDYSLSEAIDIYERNNLDIECLALDPSERHDSWAYMKADGSKKIGRRIRICEFYVYLLKMSSYTHFYHRLLSADASWGWGVDLSLWSEAGLFVGLVDKWPLSHKIHHEMYSDKLANPNDELQKHSGRAADSQNYGDLK